MEVPLNISQFTYRFFHCSDPLFHSFSTITDLSGQRGGDIIAGNPHFEVERQGRVKERRAFPNKNDLSSTYCTVDESKGSVVTWKIWRSSDSPKLRQDFRVSNEGSVSWYDWEETVMPRKYTLLLSGSPYV